MPGADPSETETPSSASTDLSANSAVHTDGHGEPSPASPASRQVEHAAVAPALEPVDAGLYGVLGLTPDASDEEIQVAYRRRAAKIVQSEVASPRDLRELNKVYEVLGNPPRRAEYDRLRRQAPAAGRLPIPEPVSPTRTAPPPHRRRNRPHGRTGTASRGDLVALIVVVLFAVAAAAVVVPRVSPNLSSLEAITTFTGLGGPKRTGTPAAVPAADASPIAIAGIPVGPSPVPSSSVPLTDQFRGSTVSMSNATPTHNTPVSVVVKLRRNDQPAANVDVFATVQYRTAKERWPAAGTSRTDQTGTTAITFDVGDATPGFEAKVTVTATVEGQDLTWATSFTPR